MSVGVIIIKLTLNECGRDFIATADCWHGGADLAISSILLHMLVKGMLVYLLRCGRPYIHIGPVALMEDLEGKRELFSCSKNGSE